MPDPLVSVVILTARRHASLARSLESLEKQFFQDFEVIMVDNAPDEESERIVSGCRVPWRHIKNREGISYAEARNRGVQDARGEFVAFIDDDCVADPAWLRNLARAAQGADAAAGMVLPLRRLPFPAWWDEELNWLLGLSVPGLLDPANSGIHYPMTSNMWVRRSILLEEKFQEIGGGFSQKGSWRYAGREDVELWRRLRIRGWRCIIAPKAVVYHDIPSDRFRLPYLGRRAFNDGLVYYKREKKILYSSWAAMDLVTCIPDLAGKIIKGEKPGRASAVSILWGFRQAGFLWGCVSDGFSPARIFQLAWLFLTRKLKFFHGLGKRLIRKGFVAYHKSQRGSRRLPRKPENLLVAACGFLGDMILLAPVLKSLRESLPGSKITLLSFPNGFTLFRDSGIVDELIVCPASGEIASQDQKNYLAQKIKGRHFDAVMVPYYHNAPPGPVFLGLRAPLVTFDKDVGLPRKLWHDLADRVVLKDFTCHEMMNLYHMASLVGAREKPRPYHFAIPEQAQARVNQILSESNIDRTALILLHAGAGQHFKLWPLHLWDSLADLILREFGIKPAFIGDEIVGRRIESLSVIRQSRAMNLCWKGDLWEMAALIKQGRVLVTNDSGPKHLAIALGTPTITLYGTMDERRWGALWDQNKHIALRAVPFDLSAEELLGLPQDYSMSRITPEKVMQSLRTHIRLSPSDHPLSTDNSHFSSSPV